MTPSHKTPTHETLPKHQPRAFTALALLLLSACATGPQKNPWAEQTTTAGGPTESIGRYDAGCLKGAVALHPDGPGYSVMRISRRRYYGHPSMRDFIERLGQRVDEGHVGPILIGDLSQPRGGPLLTGHASHQMGLDADIWFYQPSEALDLDARENLSAALMVKADQPDPGRWGIRHRSVLQLAAEFPEVERIFVSPALKRDLCAHYRGQAWLRKIRPWWGHQDHFHVRLACPADSPRCKPQAPMPAGDGCDSTLDWWFSPEARAQQEKPEMKEPTERKAPQLPKECDELVR